MYNFISVLVILISLLPGTKPIDLPKYNYEEFCQPQVLTLDKNTKVWLDGKRVDYKDVPETAEVAEVEFSEANKVIKTIKFRSVKEKESKRGQ